MNRYLSLRPNEKVFLMDTDLGQGMYGFPATVSLYYFGLSDIRLNNMNEVTLHNPLMQIFVGEFTPHQFIGSYLSAIGKLSEMQQQISSTSLLLVNTHGYITNIGENLFYDICKIVRPF